MLCCVNIERGLITTADIGNHIAAPGENDDIRTTSYIVKWSHGTAPRYSWFIRGINPDRTFYGEITVWVGHGGKQANVSGSISASDYARFLSLVREIEESVAEESSDGTWHGLLAEGPMARPRIIFHYRNDKKRGSSGGSLFLRIIDILAPYVTGFYSALS